MRIRAREGRGVSEASLPRFSGARRHCHHRMPDTSPMPHQSFPEAPLFRGRSLDGEAHFRRGDGRLQADAGAASRSPSSRRARFPARAPARSSHRVARLVRVQGLPCRGGLRVPLAYRLDERGAGAGPSRRPSVSPRRPAHPPVRGRSLRTVAVHRPLVRNLVGPPSAESTRRTVSLFSRPRSRSMSET